MQSLILRHRMSRDDIKVIKGAFDWQRINGVNSVICFGLHCIVMPRISLKYNMPMYVAFKWSKSHDTRDLWQKIAYSSSWIRLIERTLNELCRGALPDDTKKAACETSFPTFYSPTDTALRSALIGWECLLTRKMNLHMVWKANTLWKCHPALRTEIDTPVGWALA